MVCSSLLLLFLLASKSAHGAPAPGSLSLLLGESRKVLGGALRESFTLQIETDCEETSVLRASALSAGRIPIWVLPVEVKGRGCFRVVSGIFPSEHDARAALSDLPEPFRSRKDRPRVVRIAGILPPQPPVPEPSPPIILKNDPPVAATVPAPPFPRAPTPTIVQAAPVISAAPPVPLETPVREPANSPPASIPPRAREGAPASSISVPIRPPAPSPDVPLLPGREPQSSPAAKTPPPSMRDQSLQDFAKHVSFQKRSSKGSFSVSDSEIRPGEPRSILRVTTLAQEAPDPEGQLPISGLVKNSGNGAACSIQVQLKVFGTHGELLGTSQTAAVQERLNPGESTPFHGTVIVPGTAGRAQALISGSSECP